MTQLDLIVIAVLCQAVAVVCLCIVVILILRTIQIDRRQIYEEILELQDSDQRWASELPDDLRPSTGDTDPGRDAHG